MIPQRGMVCIVCRWQHVGWIEHSDTQQLKPKPPGVARQLVTFSCFAKEKVTKKKATPVCRPYGVPSLNPKQAGLRNSHCVLRQSSPKPPHACG